VDYPTAVTIKGYRYTVEYVNLSREVDTDFENTCWVGSWDTDTIRVLATQRPYAIFDTIIHEILHMVFHKNKMLLAALSSKDLEEPFIDALATELAHLLTQNKWVKLPDVAPPVTQRILKEGLHEQRP